MNWNVGIMLRASGPSAIGLCFLIILFLATVALDIRITLAVVRSFRSAQLTKTDKSAVMLMSVGAIVFILGVQIACLTSLITRQTIELWPKLSRTAIMSSVDAGIVMV